MTTNALESKLEQLRSLKRVHCIGIGGIGLSALARFLKDHGVTVSGSDRSTDTDLVRALQQEGISVYEGNRPLDRGIELVVYSDAVAESDPERLEANEKGIPSCSYFRALGAAVRGKTTVAVAGIHGKTTVTGLLAQILIDAKRSPTVIIGSILASYGTNYMKGESDLFITEACEYRGHLLEIEPTYLVITNIEWDHTDYFPDLASVQKLFATAAQRIPAHGAVITDPDDPNIAPCLENLSCKIIDYTKVQVPKLQMIGSFNEQNAKAAKAVASLFGVSESEVDTTLEHAKGTWRRFEFKGNTPSGARVYDDYAHHPTAVQKTILAAREAFPGKRIVVAFHPHLYSRTKDLFNNFVTALSEADDVLLMSIFAAREPFDPAVSSELLAQAIMSRGTSARAFGSYKEIADVLLHEGSATCIITMGAGPIYSVAQTITKMS